MEKFISYLSQFNFIGDVLIAVGILFGTFLVIQLSKWIEKIVASHLVTKTKTEVDDKIVELIGISWRRILWVIANYFVVHSLNEYLHEKLIHYVDGLFYVITVFIVAHFVSSTLQLILDFYSERWGHMVKGRIQDEFGPLFRRLIIILVYAIAIVFILKHFKQDISSLIVSLGVGSLAIALAAQDTLSNMISGFMIMTDRPFRIGDRVKLESGEKGDVYDIGLRSTKILTFDNTLIVVPNKQIVNEKLTNLSYPDPQIRVSIDVGVAYGTDLDKAKAILETVCHDHEEVLDEPPPKAYFVNFGDSSLDIRILCRVKQWGDQWRVAEELRMGVYKAFNREGVEIPFPQRVVYMVSGDEKEPVS